jgi:hypothetical protein
MRRLTIVAALLLTACGQWTRPDTTEAELKRDSDECDREARLMSFPMPSSSRVKSSDEPRRPAVNEKLICRLHEGPRLFLATLIVIREGSKKWRLSSN